MSDQPVVAVFSELIMAAHITSGYSLREVQDMSGVSASFICQILSGKRRPSRDVLIALCACGWVLPLQEINDVLTAAGYRALKPLHNETVSAASHAGKHSQTVPEAH